jgi:hypothetical protein
MGPNFPRWLLRYLNPRWISGAGVRSHLVIDVSTVPRSGAEPAWQPTAAGSVMLENVSALCLMEERLITTNQHL